MVPKNILGGSTPKSVIKSFISPLNSNLFSLCFTTVIFKSTDFFVPATVRFPVAFIFMESITLLKEKTTGEISSKTILGFTFADKASCIFASIDSSPLSSFQTGIISSRLEILNSSLELFSSTELSIINELINSFALIVKS